MSDFDASPEFRKLLAGQASVDLVQLMLEFAEQHYPDLDRVDCLLEIDRLGVSCCDSQAGCGKTDVRRRLAAISHQLYEVEGFHGNREAYYEPQNSYLNEVLKRRTGIPISLGILYMAVAARSGLKMFGCNTPGHFIVGCCAGGGQALYVDPFAAGEVLDLETCRCRIAQVAGCGNEIADECFRAAAPVDITARVLRNLKNAHAAQGCWKSLLAIQQRLAALLPQIPQERRDLGLVYLRLGQACKALPMLEQYLKVCGSEQAAALEPSLQAAKRMIAEMN